jgi:arginyl-tRNA synthetase
MQRGFSHIIDIWGPDHHGYIARLAGAVKALGYSEDRFRVLIAQQVNLLENGQPVVMSKRTGKIITLRELINEIPLDVVRYFFTMRSFESHLDFDLAEARDTSEKNPYYYVAYAHARIHSIVQKAAERYSITIPEIPPCDLKWTEERRRLLLLIARFPEEVREAALNFEPHRLIFFLYQLASALSKFYVLQDNKIIQLDPQTAATLLAVLQAVAVCLKRGLGLLGMEAPDRMDRAVEDS